MGKGDQKTRRGKINRGTAGNLRLSLKNLKRDRKKAKTR
ncbi:MAG: 30S ribosomal protein THX [Flavobacteriales bacterium]